MKTFITSITLLFASLAFSQDYIPMLQEGNSWNVDIYYEPFKGDPSLVTREMTLGEVVTINGIEYRQTLVSGNESCLLREDNGLVYKYSESIEEEYLLFDFTLEEGDVFNVSESAYGFPFFLSCVAPDLQSWVYEDALHVTSVDYVDIAGQNRKVITFEESSGVGYYYWIEGIGNWTGFDLMAETVDVSGSTIIVCFTTNGETYFMFGATSCDNTLNTQDQTLSKVAIVPNPIVDKGIMQIPEESGIDHLMIFDAAGRKLVDSSIETSSYTIDSEQYATGLYFYQVFSDGRPLKTSSFIVR